MNKVKNENYVNIAGWMINELQLKGNELIVYAIIYGFSQAENQSFNGSLQYLADWTNSTKQGVLKNLKSLVEKGYLQKSDNIINGVKFCEYRATELNRVLNKVEQGIEHSLIGGIKQSLPNIKNTDNIENIKNNKERKKETSYDLIINDYTDNEELKNTIYEFIKMRKLIKKPLTDNALQLMLNKLDRLGSNDNEKIEILNNSIMNNWQGIFELKGQQQQYRGKTNYVEPIPEYMKEGYKEDQKPASPELIERIKKLQAELKA